MGLGQGTAQTVDFHIHSSKVESVINEIYEVFKRNDIPPPVAVFLLDQARNDVAHRYQIKIDLVQFAQEPPQGKPTNEVGH